MDLLQVRVPAGLEGCCLACTRRRAAPSDTRRTNYCTTYFAPLLCREGGHESRTVLFYACWSLTMPQALLVAESWVLNLVSLKLAGTREQTSFSGGDEHILGACVPFVPVLHVCLIRV